MPTWLRSEVVLGTLGLIGTITGFVLGGREGNKQRGEARLAALREAHARLVASIGAWLRAAEIDFVARSRGRGDHPEGAEARWEELKVLYREVELNLAMVDLLDPSTSRRERARALAAPYVADGSEDIEVVDPGVVEGRFSFRPQVRGRLIARGKDLESFLGDLQKELLPKE